MGKLNLGHMRISDGVLKLSDTWNEPKKIVEVINEQIKIHQGKEYPGLWRVTEENPTHSELNTTADSECPNLTGTYTSFITESSYHPDMLDFPCGFVHDKQAYFYTCLLSTMFSESYTSQPTLHYGDLWVDTGAGIWKKKAQQVQLTQDGSRVSVQVLESDAVVETNEISAEENDFTCSVDGLTFNKRFTADSGITGHVTSTFYIAEDGSLVMRGIFVRDGRGVRAKYWNRWAQQKD